MGEHFTWDTQADAKLKELWADGVRVADIGEQIGCGRNAAIGRARRIGLPPHVAVKNKTNTRRANVEAEFDLAPGVYADLARDDLREQLKAHDQGERLKVLRGYEVAARDMILDSTREGLRPAGEAASRVLADLEARRNA